VRLTADNPLVGRSLAEGNLRARTGASVVAIMRGQELITNPEPRSILRSGDLVGFLGDEKQLNLIQGVLDASGDDNIQALNRGVEHGE